jgi:hypothetical protein
MESMGRSQVANSEAAIAVLPVQASFPDRFVFLDQVLYRGDFVGRSFVAILCAP